MEELSVEYDATSEDVANLHRHHMSRGTHRWIRLVSYAVMLLLAASLAVPAISAVRMGYRDIALFLGLAALAAFVFANLFLIFGRVIMPKITSALNLANQQNRFYALGHRAISGDASGLSVKHPGGSSEITWDGVFRVEKGKDAIYVFYTPRAAIWLPKRAFGSDESFEAAYAAISSWHAAGRSTGESL